MGELKELWKYPHVYLHLYGWSILLVVAAFIWILRAQSKLDEKRKKARWHYEEFFGTLSDDPFTKNGHDVAENKTRIRLMELAVRIDAFDRKWRELNKRVRLGRTDLKKERDEQGQELKLLFQRYSDGVRCAHEIKVWANSNYKHYLHFM